MGLKLLSLALAAATLSACDSADSPAVFTTTLAAKSASGVIPGVFAVGEPIYFELATINNTDREQRFAWCGHPGGMDTNVYDTVGNVVWRLSDGMAQLGMGHDDSFGPGEVRAYRIEWGQDYNDGAPNWDPLTRTMIVGDQAVPQGAYYVIAEGCAFQGENWLKGFTSKPVDFLIR